MAANLGSDVNFFLNPVISRCTGRGVLGAVVDEDLEQVLVGHDDFVPDHVDRHLCQLADQVSAAQVDRTITDAVLRHMPDCTAEQAERQEAMVRRYRDTLY